VLFRSTNARRVSMNWNQDVVLEYLHGENASSGEATAIVSCVSSTISVCQLMERHAKSGMQDKSSILH
jgi:hypothetical protein